MTVALIAVAAVAAFVAWEFWGWYRLRHVPGPLSFSLSIIPFARVSASGKMNIHCKAMIDKYGKLYPGGSTPVLVSAACLGEPSADANDPMHRRLGSGRPQ